MDHLPSASLVQSPHARIELARRRYFEDGLLPTGVVGAAVFESWARCLRVHGTPRQRASFEPVTTSRTQLALQKNQALLRAWQEELSRLESILGTSSCAAMLTDGTGVLIAASCVGRPHETLMPVATRLGVNLSEDAIGTNAPGVVARTGKSVCVLGGEHFFDSITGMHCAAAPIRDIHGRLAGVLDISSEHIPFTFDAAALVSLYATAIENRLLVAQSTQHLVIRLQALPELLDSAMVGLIGVDMQGRVAWRNGVARALLGTPPSSPAARERDAEHPLGWTLAELASLPATGAAPLSLPNGLRVWARAQMQAPDGRRGLTAALPLSEPMGRVARAQPVPEQPAASAGTDESGEVAASSAAPAPGGVGSAAGTVQRLRESDRALIQRTLDACGGNVSQAAERLGVSRGLIYRRLRQPAPSPSDPA